LWGGWIAALGFGLIVAAGVLLNSAVFYGGVVLLGTGTGLSTVSNLSLMLDMTAPGKVGLFIGAWGMANAFSRLTGSLLSAVVRDLVVQVAGDPLLGYLTVFSMLGAFMLISLTMLQRIDVANFRRQAGAPGLVERAALASES
jgi:BCD family chlorophyll transporter-like MFS transporter